MWKCHDKGWSAMGSEPNGVWNGYAAQCTVEHTERCALATVEQWDAPGCPHKIKANHRQLLTAPRCKLWNRVVDHCQMHCIDISMYYIHYMHDWALIATNNTKYLYPVCLSLYLAMLGCLACYQIGYQIYDVISIHFRTKKGGDTQIHKRKWGDTLHC